MIPKDFLNLGENIEDDVLLHMRGRAGFWQGVDKNKAPIHQYAQVHPAAPMSSTPQILCLGFMFQGFERTA